MPTGSAGLAIVHEPVVVAANAAAVRALASGPVAATPALAGCGATAVLLYLRASGSAPDWLSEPIAKAPGYTGLTLAAYVAGMWLPASVRMLCPPTFTAAGTAIILTLSIGGTSEVKTWLNGAGVTLLSAVSPAIATLGLYAHVYKSLLVKHARPLGKY